jgi:putative transcriptional regulator
MNAEVIQRIKACREKTGLSQARFAARYAIPRRTFENWESGQNTPPEYVVRFLERLVAEDTASCR